ncbi:MAG: PilZ domain-containing protein [Terriglobales bacterium]
MNKDMVKELPAARGSDWTRLLTDPDLVSHLGKLLQTYREVAPDKRERALLETMREIKEAAVKGRAAAASASGAPVETFSAQAQTIPLPHPEPIEEAPPFDPDSQVVLDRRRHPRIKCYVAVELHVEGLAGPVWGNLANVSRGGALIEVATAIPPGRSTEVGLWVANGKIWVKGVILTGVVTRSAPSFGVRLKFSEAELSEKEHLREFLKFVEGTTRKAHSGSSYVAQLKR